MPEEDAWMRGFRNHLISSGDTPSVQDDRKGPKLSAGCTDNEDRK